MAAITASKFSEDSYQTTTIINQDDAIWGTGSFVKSSAESSKEEFPWSSMVLDEDGTVASSWALKEESSAIIVQDTYHHNHILCGTRKAQYHVRNTRSGINN